MGAVKHIADGMGVWDVEALVGGWAFGACALPDVCVLYCDECLRVGNERGDLMTDNNDDIDMTEEEWEAQQMEEKMRMNRDDREMKGHQRK